FWSIPVSIVGNRRIAPEPVPDAVDAEFCHDVLALWRLPGTVDKNGKPTHHWLQFSPAADDAMRAFEAELEPRLGRNGDLHHIADWANKLAGGIARIAAILHVAQAIPFGEQPKPNIDVETVQQAIRLGRDYLLPHALAAFGMMAADSRIEDARRVV